MPTAMMSKALPCTASFAGVRTQRPVMRRMPVRVRAEAEQKESSSAPEVPPTASTPPAATPSPAQPTAKAPAKTPSFGETMAFSGPAPETINGRLAMLGFVAALGAELATGESIVSQLGDNPAAIAFTFLLFAGASLVPIFKGSKKEAVGPLTPNAELINGRAAMIGFAAMLVIEKMSGQALF